MGVESGNATKLIIVCVQFDRICRYNNNKFIEEHEMLINSDFMNFLCRSAD